MVNQISLYQVKPRVLQIRNSQIKNSVVLFALEAEGVGDFFDEAPIG